MAIARDPAVVERVAALARQEAWPTEKEVRRRLFIGRVQRIAIRPAVFTWTLFPLLWAASWTQSRPDVYLWEKIRPLSPLPSDYRRRYANAQAAIGLEALAHVDAWTETTRTHAARLDSALSGEPDVIAPRAPGNMRHVYYQYCAYVPDRDRFVRRCLRAGLDVETLHVDVCTRLGLFGAARAEPGADRAAEAVQIPVYESLDADLMDQVIETVRRALGSTGHAVASPVRRGRA
jgi:hypothetical protein